MKKNIETERPSVDQLETELKRVKYKSRYRAVLKSTIYTLITVAAVAVLVATLWLPVLQIYGSSMTPTLQDGEIIFTVKTSELEQGDIVAFYYNNKILVKRVIADAGDWVDISEDGTVCVNGEVLDEPYWLDSTDVNAVYGSTPDKDSTEKQNFFPFNDENQSKKSQQLNYGFATKLELKFRLTEKGTVKTTNTADDEEVPIEFNFSGDDDVWVFIDGKLALDVGGGHGRVAGYLNFRDKTYHVDRVKGSSSGVVYAPNGSTTGSFYMSGANTDEHTLTMFYMERGLWESNMMITFNFPDENQLEVKKEVDTTKVNL